jgi:hypothetical protein
MVESAKQLVTDATSEPAGYAQVTDLSSVVGIRARGARFALIQALNQNVRWRDDGTDPEAGVGMRLHAGESIPYYGDLRAIRFIEETAGAELNISVYK